MAFVNLTNLVAGTPARASEVMSNFQSIVAQLNGNVSSVNLADAAVTTGKLANGAVTSPKLSSNSVGETNLITGAVTTAKLGDLSVTTTKLADAAITDVKLAPASVGATHLQVDAVGAGKLADNAVGTTKLAPKAVTFNRMQDIPDASIIGRPGSSGAPTSGSATTMTATTDGHVLRRGSTGVLGFGSIRIGGIGVGPSSGELGDAAVDFFNLKDGAVTTAKIKDGNVTAAKLSPNAVTNTSINFVSFSGGGIGIVMLARYTGNDSIFPDHVANGSDLVPVKFVKGGGNTVTTSEGSPLTGRWSNVSGFTLSKADYGLYLRIS